ncbi:MAG: 4-hydroxybenzoyl-CoA reductase subunit alpha [Rhodospirillales bacterium]|nr:4-hydroxybenzoyl-CoA reductase subunit alpha [Rhodospirillales bacterium]MDH3917454.1 4-hydroxybenzoyl-CoA reductase subunit alpha [Rhodospirillales bacterium]MDH3968160.1 4-hydroxybenzoyl-CoA reductase subunit alpha [Rhodospirillales bacterium]
MSTPDKKPMVGRRAPLVDGIEKVSGRAMYTADLDHRGALVGRILRSPHSHAELLGVDVSKARALPGVVAVITGDDCDKPYGILPIAQNEYPLARDRVRYRGEPVAAVAAVDQKTAEEALRLICLEVRELPAYYEAGKARQPGAVDLHDDRPGNLEREIHHEFGEVDAGLSAADVVREESYDCAEVTHVHMEPHAALADYDAERDRITLHSVTQVPFYVHLRVAQCLDMDESRIRVIKPFIGGGFGARTETLNFEIVACLLARAAKGKVRIKLSREETALTHRGRPRTGIKLKIGMTREGKLTACACEVEQTGGAYGGYGIVTILYAGALLNAIYDIPAVRYDGYRVYTNTPACGAMRGHGTVDVRHAFECLLDTMATELGLDPFKVRRLNLLEAPTRTINDLAVESYGLPECLDWIEAASGWNVRKGALPPNTGLGIACSHYVSGAAKPVHWTGEPHAVVNLKLDFDGGITILTGAADIGQGSSTILAQVVGEVLGLDFDRLTVIANDSRITPKDNGSYSSRVTFMVGNAALQAAERLKAVLVAAAARKLEAKPEDIECLGETYRVAGGQDSGIPFKDVVSEALVDTGTITVKGTFTVPREYQGGKFRGAGVGPSMAYSYSATAAEVSVDEVTGRVTVDKVWVAHDCGFAINPLSVEGQVQGAVWMGLGQALSEETRYVAGLPVGPNILDYRVPTIVESPDIEVKIVETLDPGGPFGAKEASEGALSSILPAIANAVHDATGIRLTETPLTPDRVMTALVKQERAAKQANSRGAA